MKDVNYYYCCCSFKHTACLRTFPNEQIGQTEIDRHWELLHVFTHHIMFDFLQERSRSFDKFWLFFFKMKIPCVFSEPVPMSRNLLEVTYHFIHLTIWFGNFFKTEAWATSFDLVKAHKSSFCEDFFYLKTWQRCEILKCSL